MAAVSPIQVSAPDAPPAPLAEAWRAVRTRDPRFDGRFVYAVRTTGVYCRPSCAARRPHRANVRFFPDPAAAGAGQGANAAAERLRDELRESRTVSGAVYAAGYGSGRPVYERGRSPLGMTPATCRRGGAGLAISYAIVPSPLGRLLGAATDRGVCAVRLGDADGALEAELRAEFPAAELRREAGPLADWVAASVGHLEGRDERLDVPLDVRTTGFQRRVWSALRRIAYGETRSYGDVAREIGAPRAVRAVARACAANPVALVVPCHRVVRSDGTPGGYRWGARRKAALLARERAAAVPDPPDLWPL